MTTEEKRIAMEKECDKHRYCSWEENVCPFYANGNDLWKKCNLDSNEFVEQHYEELCGATEVKSDNVNHPSHYTQGGMECIDELLMIFGKEAVKHFCVCNAWKYRKRAMFKNGQEDMDKSDWYLNKYKELISDEAV